MLSHISISSSQHVQCGPIKLAYLSNLGIASETMCILKNGHCRGEAVANLQYSPPLGKASACRGRQMIQAAVTADNQARTPT